MARRFPAILVALLSLSTPLAAQTPPNIGAPLTGEVVLNRDVEVRSGPSESGRILTTLNQGKALNALGTPRGTNWTQIGVGGVPMGYVPADALDPVYIPDVGKPKPIPGGSAGASGSGQMASASGGVALIGAAVYDQLAKSAAQGLVVATRNVTTTRTEGGKRRSVVMKKGQAAGLVALHGSRIELALADGGHVEAPAASFTGVAGVSPGAGASGALFAGRIGEYLSYAEGLTAWQSFLNGPGAGYRGRPPGVWPIFRGGHIVFQAGVGPLSAADLDQTCAALTRQGYDCKPIALKSY